MELTNRNDGHQAGTQLNLDERSRALFTERHQKVRQRERSMLTRLDEEVGLSVEEAANYESHIQGKVPHNFASYDRSHSGMS